MANSPELKDSVKVLCNSLKNDPDLYYAYQSNIAMAYMDNERWYCEENEILPSALTGTDKHIIANNAAKYFLDLLIRM